MKTPIASSFDELNEHIQLQYASLSKRLQQIATYVLDRPDDIALETVVTIAKSADVQPSTLIRFAQAFGFDGFSDMQQLFKAQLLATKTDYKTRMQAVSAELSQQDLHPSKLLLHQVCDANTNALSEVAKHTNIADLEQAQKLLLGANTIHVQGVRRSYPVASYLAYILGNMGMAVNLLDYTGGMLNQQQSMIREGDVLVAISFSPYAPETASLVKAVTANQQAVIAFTDSALSYLAQSASVCFCVKEADIHSFRSLNATMCLAQTLAMSIGQAINTTENVGDNLQTKLSQ